MIRPSYSHNLNAEDVDGGIDGSLDADCDERDVDVVAEHFDAIDSGVAADGDSMRKSGYGSVASCTDLSIDLHMMVLLRSSLVLIIEKISNLPKNIFGFFVDQIVYTKTVFCP